MSNDLLFLTKYAIILTQTTEYYNFSSNLHTMSSWLLNYLVIRTNMLYVRYNDSFISFYELVRRWF